MKKYIFLLILFLGFIPHCYSQHTESRSVGVAGGTESGLSNSLGLGIRYFQSVHDIWIPGKNNEREEFKHQLVQISVFYLF